jgi:hypothetical protein
VRRASAEAWCCQSWHSWQRSQFLPNALALRSRVIDVIENASKSLVWWLVCARQQNCSA